MSRSILYAANTSSQTVLASGTTINFGQIVRRYGCNLNLSGGNVTTTGIGYYDFDANVTFVATADGTVVIQLYKDGTAIPGASSTFTVATGTTYSVTIPFPTRDKCCCESVVTAVISGAGGSVTNASINVVKD